MDGHTLTGYLALPPGPPLVGLLVLQEIFGVTTHIRKVADDFAARGFLVLAPALFDRLKPRIELAYSQIDEARTLMQQVRIDDVATDLSASIATLRGLLLPPGSRVGTVGYCWGGAIADLAACRTDVNAAVSYYGRANVSWLNERPRCPVQYHFGARDPLIPTEIVDQIRAGRPDSEVWIYPEAGHGFNCDERPEFHAASATRALERTLAFFVQHLNLP
ncbi:MAG: dienelactone hydrolase family protein [Gammaproteobacteria bacterium]|nr:dienelactone hydrolase family protein [Gammaproteobacteria bacterium]